MNTTDYHIHSIYSPDGHNTPDEICHQALTIGLNKIAITEHAEWYHGQTGFPDVTAYFKAMAAVQAKYEPLGLRVLTGVELGNPHDVAPQAQALLQAYPFDIVIGSLHWLYNENIHAVSCFEGRNPDTVYTDYFVELGKMTANFQVDIVAHFDRIIWRGALLGYKFDPWRYEKVIKKAFTHIAQRGQTLELNTKFLDYTPNWNEQLLTMLIWYRQVGGTRLVLNTDAHQVQQLGRNMQIGVKLATSAGFTPLTNLAAERRISASV